MMPEEVLALRALGLAIVAQCDAALARLAAPTAEPAIGVAAPASCPHPSERLLNTATVTAPHRAKCTACGETVERAA